MSDQQAARLRALVELRGDVETLAAQVNEAVWDDRPVAAISAQDVLHVLRRARAGEIAPEDLVTWADVLLAQPDLAWPQVPRGEPPAAEPVRAYLEDLVEILDNEPTPPDRHGIETAIAVLSGEHTDPARFRTAGDIVPLILAAPYAFRDDWRQRWADVVLPFVCPGGLDEDVATGLGQAFMYGSNVLACGIEPDRMTDAVLHPVDPDGVFTPYAQHLAPLRGRDVLVTTAPPTSAALITTHGFGVLAGSEFWVAYACEWITGDTPDLEAGRFRDFAARSADPVVTDAARRYLGS